MPKSNGDTQTNCKMKRRGNDNVPPIPSEHCDKKKPPGTMANQNSGINEELGRSNSYYTNKKEEAKGLWVVGTAQGSRKVDHKNSINPYKGG